MQIQSDIGIASMAQQQAVHGFQLRRRCRQVVEHLGHGLANQRDVGFGIVAQLSTDQRGHRSTQFDERTVEILAAAQFETAHMGALQMLIEADRVGHRHQFDYALQLALGFEFGQALLQLPGRAHARQFVGVQAGLDVNLAGARAITKHAEAALGAQMTPGQWMVDALHGNSDSQNDEIHCGSGLAREGVLSVSIDVARHTAFASKAAPTGSSSEEDWHKKSGHRVNGGHFFKRLGYSPPYTSKLKYLSCTCLYLPLARISVIAVLFLSASSLSPLRTAIPAPPPKYLASS